MEESMDMDKMVLRPQNFLFGCELKADKKEYTFKVDDDESEHQLSLRTVSLGGSAKDELHIIEAEGMNYEGKQMKVTLASLRPSVQSTVSLGGFEITPPVTLKLKSGSGPVYISGQHLVALEDLGSSEEEDEEEEEEDDDEEEETTEVTKNSKRPATSISKVSQKKMKLAVAEDDDDDEDDDSDSEDEDDDDEEDEDEDDDEDVEKAITEAGIKAAKKSLNRNGKASGPSTPAKIPKTPDQKGKPDAKQTPKSPKTPLTPEQMKAKLQGTLDKGGILPKVETRFTNYVKNCFRTDNKKVIDDLWNWRKAQKDVK